MLKHKSWKDEENITHHSIMREGTDFVIATIKDHTLKTVFFPEGNGWTPEEIQELLNHVQELKKGKVK